VADTHTYQDGLPSLFRFFERQGITRLACLGDCPPEPFRPWLKNHPRHQLFWVYDFHGPEMSEATACAMALELGGGLMLVAGLYARSVALALFFYTLSLALIFHAYWTVSDPAAARIDASSFFGHLSMMGGMLFVVAFGAGAYSVDALMNQWSLRPVAARRAGPF